MGTRSRVAATGLALALAGGSAGACDAQDPPLDDARLEAMIDSLLPAIADAAGMEVRREVSFAVQPRPEVRRFIERQLEEEMGPGELAGMDRAYKALGLLPDTLDLRALLLELYTEQVVGYYDPQTDRLYVVEGAPAETAGPVVAHELVHALQDQHADLDALVDRERGNDRQMAAQAAAEGQATLVMIALQAAATTGQPLDPAALPDLGAVMRPALEAENARFPVFQSAPRVIRETLLFPYLGGASFLQALYRARTGTDAPVPFGELLPQSTEQVMEPERAFLGERDAPTEIELAEAPAGWTVAYQNTLGRLETDVLLRERVGDGVLATGWDGDRYALLEGPDGATALAWYSVWDDTGSADRVADALGGIDGWTVERVEHDGRPVIRVVIGPADAAPELAGMEEVAVR